MCENDNQDNHLSYMLLSIQSFYTLQLQFLWSNLRLCVDRHGSLVARFTEFTFTKVHFLLQVFFKYHSLRQFSFILTKCIWVKF